LKEKAINGKGLGKLSAGMFKYSRQTAQESCMLRDGGNMTCPIATTPVIIRRTSRLCYNVVIHWQDRTIDLTFHAIRFLNLNELVLV